MTHLPRTRATTWTAGWRENWPGVHQKRNTVLKDLQTLQMTSVRTLHIMISQRGVAPRHQQRPRQELCKETDVPGAGGAGRGHPSLKRRASCQCPRVTRALGRSHLHTPRVCCRTVACHEAGAGAGAGPANWICSATKTQRVSRFSGPHAVSDWHEWGAWHSTGCNSVHAH